MANKISTAIVLFTKRAKSSGKYPAKLRITYNRVQRYYGIDTKERTYEFTKDEFKKITGEKPRGEYKVISLEFSLHEEKAKKIITQLKEFSFDDFKSLWGIKGASSNVITFFDDRFKQLDAKGKYPANCSSAKTALVGFFKKSKYIDFREITPSRLEKYQQWLLGTNRKISTVSTYMAEVRTVFNNAIKIHAIPEEIYPFGKNKYVIPQTQVNKRALKLNQIKAIFEYETEPLSKIDYAKDFWIFSYLGNGMNMADIYRLKYKNIEKDSFSFIRNKTKDKGKQVHTVTVPLTEYNKRIIEKWGNRYKDSDSYVFPILIDYLTPKQKRSKIHHKVNYINEGLRVIQKDLGIEMKLTTYSARHSFATTLKRSGVSMEFISESLGHHNLDMTQRYLDSFENEQRQEYAKHLTNF